VENLRVSPDGHLVARQSGPTVKVWRLRDFELVGELRHPEINWEELEQTLRQRTSDRSAFLSMRSLQDTGGLISMRFSPGGAWAVTEYCDDKLRLWSLSDTRSAVLVVNLAEQEFSGQRSGLIEFSANDQRVLLFDGVDFVVWDVPTQQLLRRLPKRVRDARLSPDGSYVAYCIFESQDTIIYIDYLSAEPPFELMSGGAYSISIGPGGSTLVAEKFRSIDLWNIAEKRKIGSWNGPERDPIYAWSDDGKLFAHDETDDAEAHVVVSESSTGLEVSRFASGPVSRLAFGPDRRLLATNGDEGVSIWKTDSEEVFIRLDGASAARGVWFSPDGKCLITSGKTTRCWILDSDELITEAGRCLGRRQLDSEREWPRFLGDETYRVTCPPGSE
jgi:WD40 repeat protein